MLISKDFKHQTIQVLTVLLQQQVLGDPRSENPAEEDGFYFRR